MRPPFEFWPPLSMRQMWTCFILMSHHPDWDTGCTVSWTNSNVEIDTKALSCKLRLHWVVEWCLEEIKAQSCCSFHLVVHDVPPLQTAFCLSPVIRLIWAPRWNHYLYFITLWLIHVTSAALDPWGDQHKVIKNQRGRLSTFTERIFKFKVYWRQKRASKEP